VLDPLRRAGVTDESLLAEVQHFWRQRFFTDAWLAHDTPYPGVAAFLHALKDEGFRLAYLTGRDTVGMEAGTRKSFADHGLPSGPEEVFFFKPAFEMDDREFKASVCEHVAALGTLVVTVDNEPANVNLFRSAFPEALVVWLDTVTSPHPEPLVQGIEKAKPDYFRLP
jgi:phosphoglycolate phosphatase-like HAD superfamily hydrolase